MVGVEQGAGRGGVVSKRPSSPPRARHDTFDSSSPFELGETSLVELSADDTGSDTHRPTRWPSTDRRPLDAQLLHARVESAGVDPQFARRAVRAFDLPGGRLADAEDMRPLARLQRVTFPGISGGGELRVACASRGWGNRTQLDGLQPYRACGRQNDRAFEDVFQFADVAGPVISGQPIRDEVGDPLDVSSELASLALTSSTCSITGVRTALRPMISPGAIPRSTSS